MKPKKQSDKHQYREQLSRDARRIKGANLPRPEIQKPKTESVKAGFFDPNKYSCWL